MIYFVSDAMTQAACELSYSSKSLPGGFCVWFARMISRRVLCCWSWFRWVHRISSWALVIHVGVCTPVSRPEWSTKGILEGPMWTDSSCQRCHKSAPTAHSPGYICAPQVLSIRRQRPGPGRRARPISGQNWPSPTLASA